MLLDLHCDVLTDVMVEYDAGRRDVLRRRHVPRFRAAGMVGGVFALWNDDPARPAQRLREGLRAMCEELQSARDIVQPVCRRRDFYEALDAGRLAAVLGMEGMAGIGEDLGFIYEMRQMGFRVAGLAWNEQNQLATGAHGDETRGLTGLGKNAVRLLQDMDILVDVSHLNDASFWDVARAATKPFIASHSNVRRLCGVARNLTDDQIKEIGKSGGLIGVNAFNEFIDPALPRRTVARLVEHMAAIADSIGVEHLGLGFDFMEYFGQNLKDWVAKEEFRLTEGLTSIADAENLLCEMRRQGFGPEDIENVCWKNFVRLLEA